MGRKANIYVLKFALGMIFVMAVLMVLFSHQAQAACVNPAGSEGDIVYNSTHHVMQYCNNADEWIAMVGSSSGGGSSGCVHEDVTWIDGTDNTYAMALWQQGDYVYLTQDDNQASSRIMANATATGTQVGSYDFPTGVANESALWGDGTYVYAGAGNYLYALTFNGTTFSAVSVNTGVPVYDIWGDGTYIYIANSTAGIKAYTFNGTTLSQAGSTYNTPGDAYSIWSDGTYIYSVDDGSSLRAFSFNGTSFTLIATEGGNYQRVVGDGTYVYGLNRYGDNSTFTFNGTAFTDLGVSVYLLQAAGGGYVYTGVSNAIVAYSFDGSAYTYEATYAAGSLVQSDMQVGDDGRVYALSVYGDLVYLKDCSI